MRTLAEQYGLAVQAPPNLLANGLVNATWQCMTDQGAWYVKVFAPATGTLARVQEETALYDYLRHHGLDVPFVRPSKSGAKVTTLVTQTAHYAMMVMQQEALRALAPATLSHGELTQVAAAIGELHTVLKNYSPNPQLRASTAGRPSQTTSSPPYWPRPTPAGLPVRRWNTCKPLTTKCAPTSNSIRCLRR